MYDKQMAKDPNYVEKQGGLLTSMSALDELLAKPENQGTPREIYYALLLLLIGLDTSPVIAAAMRKPTRSEMRAAFEEVRQNLEDGTASEQRRRILEKAIQEEIAYLKDNNIVARGEQPASVDPNDAYKKLGEVIKPGINPPV